MTTTRACLTRWRLTIQTISNADLKWKSKIRIENSNSIEHRNQMKDPILVVCSLLGESCWDLWGKWALSAFSQTTYFHVDYQSMINFPRRLHPRLWDCERALVWGRLWGLQYFAKKKIKLVSVANTPNGHSIICQIDDCLVGPDSSDTWYRRHQISAANVRL